MSLSTRGPRDDSMFSRVLQRPPDIALCPPRWSPSREHSAAPWAPSVSTTCRTPASSSAAMSDAVACRSAAADPFAGVAAPDGGQSQLLASTAQQQ